MGPSHLDPYTFKLVDRNPVQCANDDAWWRWYMNMDNRRVAETRYGDAWISTVFTSLDLRPYPGQGKLFETKIFGGKYDGKEWLAATWKEAEQNHAKALLQVSVGNASEEK
jgi:hypothetical protein